MKASLWWSCGCAAAALLLGMPQLRAQTTGDPWARVIPPPTACYQSQDQFAAKNQAAIELVAAEVKRQETINSKVTANNSSAPADPFAAAQRVQEMLMKDPQAATKFMEVMGANKEPGALSQEALEQDQRTAKWDADRDALMARYKNADEQGRAPGVAQLRALQKKIGGDEDSAFLPELGTPASARAEFDQIKRRWDAGYGTLCAQWFSATGQVPAFLKRYKDYLVQDRIPYREKSDAQKVMSMTMLAGGSAGFRSTAALEAVEDYMKMAGAVFALREEAPRCTATGCK